MTIFNKELLDHLKELSEDNPKVEQLIEEKKQKLNDIDKSQFSYQKHTPKPTPSGTPKIDRTYKSKTLSDEQIKERKEAVTHSYNEKIEQSIHEHFESRGYETELNEVKELRQENLVMLHEKDSYAVLDKQKQQELEKNEPIKDTLDITMDEEKSKEVFGDLETEQEITSLEEKEIKHNKDIEQSILMNEEKSENIFGRHSNLDDFNDNSKDVTVDRNKTPSPADDFE